MFLMSLLFFPLKRIQNLNKSYNKCPLDSIPVALHPTLAQSQGLFCPFTVIGRDVIGREGGPFENQPYVYPGYMR